VVDPITALAVASTAFNAIKKGFEVGNDLESMAGDIGRWMGAIQDLSDAEKKAKNPPLFRAIVNKSSVEQEAMQVFAAKQKAKQMEDQLREYVKWTHGGDAWKQILAMRAKIRQERLDQIKAQAARRAKFKERSFTTVAVLITLALSSALIWGLIEFLLAMKERA
jgi:hypothetical protein|tara:strand:+ start:1624 stop:2118 length:495 start_codon:yes stop_codon:yes gene_type:complete